MKILAQFTFIVLMVFILSVGTEPTHDQQTTIPTATSSHLIKPGESFDGILVTMGGSDSTLVFDWPSKQENNVWKCSVPCGKTANPLAAVYDPDNMNDPQAGWETLVHTIV